jgi:hypothetical protein
MVATMMMSKALLPTVVPPLSLRRWAVLAAMFAGVLLLAGCGWFAERWEWNQKLTVEVETPDGVRLGSAVSHVSWRAANALGNYPADYSGEATVVDLGRGRYLFALIGESTKQIAAYTLHAELGERRSDYRDLFPKVMAFRGVRDVPRDQYPLLVTFTDLNDPTTVLRVDPADLAASFGPGVSLKRIKLEITDEKVTKGSIERLLTWLDEYYGKKLDGQRYETIKAENRLANSLGAGDFDTRP